MISDLRRLPAWVIRWAEVKILRREAAVLYMVDSEADDGSGAEYGREDSEIKSLTGISRVCTFSSEMPRPLITALLPRREILMRYVREDCVWA